MLLNKSWANSPGVGMRTLARRGLRACQRVSVVRARLREIHAGSAQTPGSLRLHRNAADPTRPRPLVVISPDITSLSQKPSERLRAATSQRSLRKSGTCTETCKEAFTLAVFHSWLSAAARDQTTGSFGEKCETWCTEDRFTRCGRPIQEGRKWCGI